MGKRLNSKKRITKWCSMSPNGQDTFITEDDMGEGFDFPYAEQEIEDILLREQRKFEKYRRIKENKTVR